jgi:hypothetical protein
MKNKIVITLLAAVFSINVFSQLVVDGEFRTRFIADHGQKIPLLKGEEGDYSFDQRSRLRFNYRNDKFTSRFTLQDARIWGSEDLYNKTGIEGSTQAFDIHEAWVELTIKGNSTIRIGRQEWNYNDMRILSWRNWWTSGMSLDALLYKFHNKETGLFVDIGVSYNNDGSRIGLVDNTDWSADKIKTMNFLNVRKTLGEKTDASLMLSLSGKVDTSNNAILGTGTHGFFLNHNQGKKSTDGFLGSISAYYQHGTDVNRGSDSNYKNISAYLLAANIGYRAMDKKLEVIAGIELISGRDYENSDEDYNNTRHSFDLHYGARFPYYGGQMNHFIIQDSYLVGTKGGGYMNPSLKVNYKLSKKDILNISYYMPILTTSVRAHNTIDPATNKPSGKEVDENGDPVYWKGNLGNYFDVNYTRKFSKEIILKAGFSYAYLSDIKNQMVFGYQDAAAKQLNELGQNYFGWVALIIKPTFFKN